MQRLIVVTLACISVAVPAAASAHVCQTADGLTFASAQNLGDKYTLALSGCTSDDSVVPTSEQLQLFDQAHPSSQPILTFGDPPVRRNRLNHVVASARHVSVRAYVNQVSAVSRAYNIDPDLLHAIMYVESRGNARAISRAGARGLMQVMPATARRFGVSDPMVGLHDPMVNLSTSAAYLKTLQRLFGNNLTLVLAAYNAGENAVRRYGGRVPPYPETRGYVSSVLAQYRSLTAQR